MQYKARFEINSYKEFEELMVEINNIKTEFPKVYQTYIMPLISNSWAAEVANRFGVCGVANNNKRVEEKFLNDHYRTRYTANDINMKWRRKMPLGGDYLTRYLIENDISKVKKHMEA